MEERFMRILVMFDMPTYTKEDRKNSAKFRKELIKDGFLMLQFSVYARICKGVASANSHLNRLDLILPPKGHIRALILTEKQFDQMRLLLGQKSELEKKNVPRQLVLF
ncbi:CRISPR-associated endonuclease Cas2 [Helicobacter sp. 12S02232-10]|uniref:CRISPR-associated endonuclease Cas2 n=1 Tax=Helicobacter sp. 12S02232-10 TaxID=1476197 RepID=UPI000BC97D9C|nr:CRISPR-associated endonuclease Cas2 [Helicobacter sp. 12S02232-10]PAF46218.1 CRISPR-associated endonuclease Cas2 [Helicobacter sp. 12S02232-10]